MKSQPQSSNILIRKWHQLGCGHYWVKGSMVDWIYGKGIVYEWICKVCDKKIRRTNYYSPISFYLEDPTIEKDPLYNMSPLIRKNDDF